MLIILQNSYIIIFLFPCHLLCLYVFWIEFCLLITYLRLKVNHQPLNHSRTILDVISVRFSCPA